MAKRVETKFVCCHCGKEFYKLVSQNTKLPKRPCCSFDCASKDKSKANAPWTEERRAKLSIRNKGSSNPNYGKRWSKAQRDAFSVVKVDQYAKDEDLRYRCGSSNRGKKFGQERINAMHGKRDPSSYSHPVSEETKVKISVSSKAKWTEEYKKQHKQTMIERGYWAVDSDGYRNFYRESNWIGPLTGLSENERMLVEELGLFSKTNTKGVVRDHWFPRKAGFELGVPSCILRHPENCRIITHSENIKKGFADRKMSLEEKIERLEILLTRIELTSIKWDEQDACIAYITQRKEDV